MEKKALLAFVLSMLVLFAWQMLYVSTTKKKSAQPPAPASSAPGPATGPTTGPTTAPEAPVAPQPQVKSVAPEQLFESRAAQLDQRYRSWTMETPLYKMQILEAGGRLHFFHLKDYRRGVAADSGPMDLITTRESGYLPLDLNLLHHPDWELATRSFVSDSPQEQQFKAADGQKKVVFTTEVAGKLRLTKSYTLDPNSYVMNLAVRLDNLSGAPLSDQLGIGFYFEPYNGIAKETSYNQSTLSYSTKQSVENVKFKDLVKAAATIAGPFNWMGYGNSYFIQALMPAEEGGYQAVARVLNAERGIMNVVYLSEPFTIAKGQHKQFEMKLYIGPKTLDQLGKAGHDLTQAVDYGWFSFLAKPLLRLLKWLYLYLHNYGLAIIVLTILVKLLFWPLTHKSYQSMNMMKKLQPKITQIREKYKEDREKLNEELVMLYRTHKVNPLGGCLPMVLQIPVFFALYRMLYGTVELLHQPFYLWINDLTAPDRLSVGFDIPYLGGLPVLTLLMGASMFISQKLTPSSGDPRQEKMMLLLPIVFTVFFVNFPSGLVLYWLVNNVLSIMQQYWIHRRHA